MQRRKSVRMKLFPLAPLDSGEVAALIKSCHRFWCVNTHDVPLGSLSKPHISSFSSQTAAASTPSILLQTHRGAMISLFPSGRTRPDRRFLQPRPVSLSPGHRSVLTDTDSLRHSRASGAPLLFWPTRKSPRQATPPPRHREQQHGDWRGTRKQMATLTGNERSASGEGRKMPSRSESERQPLSGEASGIKTQFTNMIQQ